MQPDCCCPGKSSDLVSSRISSDCGKNHVALFIVSKRDHLRKIIGCPLLFGKTYRIAIFKKFDIRYAFIVRRPDRKNMFGTQGNTIGSIVVERKNGHETGSFLYGNHQGFRRSDVSIIVLSQCRYLKFLRLRRSPLEAKGGLLVRTYNHSVYDEINLTNKAIRVRCVYFQIKGRIRKTSDY